ncbi:MAG: class I SAM-dependent methyltransferase [Actinomycetota bacterium]
MSETGPSVRAEQPWLDPLLADLYDVFPFDADIPLYLDLASEQGGNVLEIACGSGRLLLPLASAGHEVVGVDASPHMLALARNKLASAGQEVASRCRLVQDDARSFRLDADFGLAIIAVKSFVYLTRRAEQQAALARVRRHLRPGGVLALDLLNPSPDWVTQADGSLRQDLAQEVPGKGMVMRTETAVSTDRATQVRTIRSVYDIVASDGGVTRRVVEWPFRYTYRFEAELLLEAAGFTVEGVFGGYRREPLTSDSPTLMLLARVSERA